MRLAEDQELEEEEGNYSKDEGKTILKNKFSSCAEWTFILEEMCELLLKCKHVFMSLSIKPGVFALKSFHCVLVGDFASLVFLKPATKKLVSTFSVRVSSWEVETSIVDLEDIFNRTIFSPAEKSFQTFQT